MLALKYFVTECNCNPAFIYYILYFCLGSAGQRAEGIGL